MRIGIGMKNIETKQPIMQHCLLCHGAQCTPQFQLTDFHVTHCDQCGFLFLNPQPSDQELTKIYNDNYFLHHNNDNKKKIYRELKQATANLYLTLLQKINNISNGKLLEIGCGEGDFLLVAEKKGFNATGIDYSHAACEVAKQRVKNSTILCGE